MDFDLYVVGGGSGGVRAARMSAGMGARVGLAEAGRMGGTCVNVGCVPKKLFSYASHFHEDYQDAVGFGWEATAPRFDWPTLVANKDREIHRLNGIYAGLLERTGVTVHRGWAKVTGPNEVEVDGVRYSAANILIATGGQPIRPAIPGAELGLVSDDLFALPALPERMIIVGGGYIALEFASILRGLGVEIDVLVRSELLRGFDHDVAAHVQAEMEKKGVRFHIGPSPTRVDKTPTGVRVHLDKGEPMDAGAVFFATGRRANTEGLGLEALGVCLTYTGAIEVDEQYRSAVHSIRAVGDVIDRIQLTPVALAEGMFVANDLFGSNPRPVNYPLVPTAVFTHPNIATVGLTEHDARIHHGALRLFKSTFRPMKHTLSGRDEKTFMKLVVDAATDKVVGCHLVGPDAGELIQGLAVALTAGATKDQFDATIGIHPTAAEEFVTMRTEWTP